MSQAFPDQTLFGLLLVPKQNLPDSRNMSLLESPMYYRFWWYSRSFGLLIKHLIGYVNEYPTMHYFIIPDTISQ